MNRRSLLRFAPAAMAAPFLGSLSSRAQAADPVLAAILAAGGKVKPAPAEWKLWSGIVYDAAGTIVGYISRATGCLQLCTPTWPLR